MSELKLKDCCISISDGDHLPPPKVNNGIPFITISNIDSSNHIDFKNTLFVPEEYYENLDNIRKPIINDILYSVVGSFGKAVLVKENKKFVFQRHIAILRPNPDIVNPSYLYYIMSSKSFYNKADVVAIGAAQRTISLTSLRNLKINLPTIDIQNRIAEILSRYEKTTKNRLSYWKNQHSVFIKNGLLIYVFQGMRILRLWMGCRKDGRRKRLKIFSICQ